MQQKQLGQLWPVSALTIGGGGIGQVWGDTTREESVAVLTEAIDAGINLIDVAPLYGRGEAESVVAAAYSGKLPEGVRILTKCMLGDPGDEPAADIMRRSLENSLSIMQLARVDLFVLHSNILPEGFRLNIPEHIQDRIATPLPVFQDQVVPAFEALRAEGLIGHWGITGVGLPQTIMDVLQAEVRPGVTQCVANLLDSPGGMARFSEPAQPRDIIRSAQENGVGVLGIRAVQAGALTAAIDREMPDDDPEMQDFQRAAPFREIAQELGESPASLAHRYALSMQGVDSVILGVKNRTELQECIAAEAAGSLSPELMTRIDSAVNA